MGLEVKLGKVHTCRTADALDMPKEFKQSNMTIISGLEGQKINAYVLSYYLVSNCLYISLYSSIYNSCDQL